jgi:hypothetical protein
MDQFPTLCAFEQQGHQTPDVASRRLFRVGLKPGTEVACCSFPLIADFADVRRFCLGE